MAFDVGSPDGTILIAVDGRSAEAGFSAIEARMAQMGQVVSATIAKMNQQFSAFQRMLGGLSGGGGGGGLAGLTNAMNGFGSATTQALAALGGFLSLRAIVGVMTEFASSIIEVNRAYTGFIASMSVIKGSMKAASDEYEFLLATSNKLGISIETSITQYHRLAASMKNADSTGELARQTFAGISEAAVVLHSRGRDVSLIFNAIEQMASKGKLSLEELQRQLGNTLPGAVSMGARAMMESQRYIEAGIKSAGEAEQKLRKDIEKGTINVYEFILRLSNQLKKEYGQGVEYASDKFTANFNRMQNSVFELYRVVGSSGAMEGLTKIVKELTGLFNDSQGGAAIGLGQALGDMFKDLAEWISKLDSRDVVSFFKAIQGAVIATDYAMVQLMSTFGDLAGEKTLNPVMTFAEWTSRAFAGLADVISMVINGIKALFNIITMSAASTGRLITAPLSAAATGIDKTAKFLGITLPGADHRQQARSLDASLAGQVYQDKVDLLDATGNFDNVLTNGASIKTKELFDQLKANLPSAGRKGGTTADIAAKYVNPLGDAELQKLLEQIQANSNAPNSGGKTGKPSWSDITFMKEQSRMVKSIAGAQQEYENVLANKTRTEGKNEAQVRALLKTDDAYLKMSSDKREALLLYAKQLDEISLKVENTRKAQNAYFDALEHGYDVQSRINELEKSGFQNQFRETTNVQNSFKPGGANETMDLENQKKMLAAADKQDTDNRRLAMAEYTAQIKASNAEIYSQANMLGMTSLEQQKATEFRKIDIDMQKQMVGATEDQQRAYLELAEVLKGDVGDALEYIYNKQRDATTGIMDAMNKYLEQASDEANNWGTLVSNTFNGLEDALTSFVETGKISFTSLTDSIIKDLARIASNKMISGIAMGLMGAITGDSGAENAGSLADLFSSKSSFTTGFAKGGAFDGIQRFAKGGAFTNKIVTSSTLFKFANGSQFGEMGEAGPEAVVPLKRSPSGALGVTLVGSGAGSRTKSGAQIIVNNYGSDNVQVEDQSTQGPDGEMMERYVISIVAADTARGGRTARATAGRFGLKEPV